LAIFLYVLSHGYRSVSFQIPGGRIDTKDVYVVVMIPVAFLFNIATVHPAVLYTWQN